MNIGILTSGGDCPGLNAYIRAAVLTLKNHGDHTIYGFHNGFQGLVEDDYQIIEKKDIRNIEYEGGTILGTSNKGSFGNVGSLREPTPEEIKYLDKVKETVSKLNLDGVICSGGDGSLRIAHFLSDYTGINFVGVPKTIDNDLANTDVSFGFDTAVATATDAINKIADTALSHHRVMIVEVMGRDAGWIALQSGIAGSADVILIPEIEISYEKVTDFVKNKAYKENNTCIIVIAEGAKPTGHSQAKFPTSGGLLAEHMEKNSDLEVRLTILGHIQRGGSPTPFDRILATRFGQKAAECILTGQKSVFVTIRNNKIETVPLKEASTQTRMVPLDNELIKAAQSMGIYFGD